MTWDIRVPQNKHASTLGTKQRQGQPKPTAEPGAEADRRSFRTVTISDRGAGAILHLCVIRTASQIIC